MEVRIALVMGGGVSLGAFSAGALGEVLRLLGNHATPRIRLDVATGASAGSLTLALALQRLFAGAQAEAVAADLRSAWVEKISIERLLPDLDRHQAASLFSANALEEIAAELIDFSVWNDAPPNPLVENGVLVAFSLTNLNGLPLRAHGLLNGSSRAAAARAEVGGPSPFADALETTFHDDVVRFALRPAGGPAPESRVRPLDPWRDASARAAWSEFVRAAIASGAFPGAFPPVAIRRQKDEYDVPWPQELGGAQAAFPFDYVDGGILENEPLREAIHLASLCDQQAPPADGAPFERIFLLIDPNVSGTSERFTLPFNQALRLSEEIGDDGRIERFELSVPGHARRLIGVAGRIAGTLASQARFRDWLRAGRVNRQIDQLEAAVPLLERLAIRAAGDDEASTAVDDLLASIYADKADHELSGKPGVDPIAFAQQMLAADLARMQRSSALPPGSPQADLYARLTLLVAVLANLRTKRKLELAAITPKALGEDGLLAGDFLSNFGGFFHEAYRLHDFGAGAWVAGRVLDGLEAGGAPLVSGASFASLPARPAADPHYALLPPPIRERFETLLAGHVGAFARELLGKLIGSAVAPFAPRLVRPLLLKPPGGREEFLLRVENAGSYFLGAAAGAEKREADATGVVETIVVVRSAWAGNRARFDGPHLRGSESGAPHLELFEDGGWFRSDRRVVDLVLKGDPEAWIRRARSLREPVLRVDLVAAGRPPRIDLDVGQLAER